MNKKNRSHQLILNQMKECFKKEDLPVFEDDHQCDYNPYRFSSKLQKGHFTADILCWYDADKYYAGMRIILGKGPSGVNITDILKMANYINGGLTQYHLAPCPDCGAMELRAGLYVSGKDLPADKFSWLLSSMIRDGEKIHSYLEKSMSKGLNYEDLPTFSNAFSDCDPGDPRFSKTLDDIEDVLNKLDLSIKNDFKTDKSFCLEFCFEDVPDLIVRIGIRIEDDPDRVILALAPKDTIPEENIPAIIELISWINQSAVVDQMHLHSGTYRTIICSGVLLTNGVLDVKEFERALRTLLGNGSVYLSMVLKQLSSEDSPKDLANRMFTDHFEKHTSRH